MLRVPQEPEDTYKPFGEKVVKKTAADTKPAKPYTDYVPVKNRPGWEDDGFGHQRYDATRDAVKHENDVEKALVDDVAKATTVGILPPRCDRRVT